MVLHYDEHRHHRLCWVNPEIDHHAILISKARNMHHPQLMWSPRLSWYSLQSVKSFLNTLVSRYFRKLFSYFSLKMRQFLVLMSMSSVAVQKDLNIRSFGHFYGLCCREEEYSLSFNLRLCKWMKLTKTLCELVCGSGGVKSPPHHLLCFQDAGYAAHLSHRVSHSSLVTNASSVRSFPVSIVFCHFFPLAYPLTWFLYSFLCSPPSPALSSLPPVSSSLSPLQCVVLSLPPLPVLPYVSLSLSALWNDQQEAATLWWTQIQSNTKSTSVFL